MRKIKEYLRKNYNNNLLISLVAVLTSFLIATIVMIATNISPIGFYNALIRTFSGFDFTRIGEANFFNARYIGEFLQISMIITLTGLSVAFAFRTGLFNIGSEGQVMLGAFGAAMVGVVFELPIYIHLPLALFVSALFGAIWGFIPGILKAKFGIHEVVVTIMLNYAAMYLTNYWIRLLPGSSLDRTKDVAESALLKSDLLFNLTNKSRFNWGFIMVILSILFFRFIISKTTFGYELRAVGFNKEAAEYAGIKVKSRMVYSMSISGAFSGLAGSLIVLGTFGFGRALNAFENYGFDGIAVALLGANTPVGVFFSGLLFGGLKSAQTLMQANRIPLEISIIVSSLIILFVAMKYGFEAILKRMGSNKGDKNEND